MCQGGRGRQLQGVSDSDARCGKGGGSRVATQQGGGTARSTQGEGKGHAGEGGGVQQGKCEGWWVGGSTVAQNPAG